MLSRASQWSSPQTIILSVLFYSFFRIDCLICSSLTTSLCLSIWHLTPLHRNVIACFQIMNYSRRVFAISQICAQSLYVLLLLLLVVCSGCCSPSHFFLFHLLQNYWSHKTLKQINSFINSINLCTNQPTHLSNKTSGFLWHALNNSIEREEIHKGGNIGRRWPAYSFPFSICLFVCLWQLVLGGYPFGGLTWCLVCLATPPSFYLMHLMCISSVWCLFPPALAPQQHRHRGVVKSAMLSDEFAPTTQIIFYFSSPFISFFLRQDKGKDKLGARRKVILIERVLMKSSFQYFYTLF